MKQYIASRIFSLLGWRLLGEVPPHIRKYVLVAAPHTSNWDYFYGRLYFFAKGIPVKILIKKELFFFPLGIFLKALGSIPVDRSQKNNLTHYLAGIFEQYDKLAMLFTPEGTRKYSPNWKKGFYYTALEAKVPIVLGYIDYKEKIGGIGPIFEPSGDADADIEKIKDFYRTKTGKYPEQGVL